MTDVFISYKRRARDRVQAIASRLEALGVDVWFDAELEPGKTFSATISDEVRRAKSVLVCWTNDAFPHGGDRQGWVLGEATIGRDRGVLVPVFLEKADLDPPWNTVHTEDLSSFGTERGRKEVTGWRNMLLAIGRLLDRPGLADLDRAQINRSPSAMAEWARAYPDDPEAGPILATTDSSELEDLAEAIEVERRSENIKAGRGAAGRAIFVLVFLSIAIGAGGAGFWAWQEGFINLDQMFGKGTPVVTTTAQTPVAEQNPANELRADERLSGTETTAAVSVEPLALQTPTGNSKTEERQGGVTNTEANTTDQAVAAIDPSAVAGGQSLLLEAPDDGTTGAVPFSGAVSWTRDLDETGQPILIGTADIPARDLSVEVLIRKNTQKDLPANYVIEIDFTVPDTFIGGSISGLPGVLLKNEELVQGAPLVGASARVEGNSFLFALSAAPEDNTANTNLLTTRKWMDLALIYASGKRAIITLEKDAAAQQMFSEVFATWSGSPPALAYVQLSSSPSEADAQASLRSLQSKFGSLFGGRALVIQSADFGQKGIWYRVKLPAISLADAGRICANIKANGGDCIVSAR